MVNARSGFLTFITITLSSSSIAMEMSSSMSNPGAYAGLTHSRVKYKEQNLPSLQLGATGVLAGYRFSPNVTIEGRLLVSSQSDEALGIKFELDRYVGVNLIGNIPLDRNYSLYGAVGYGRLTGKGSSSGVSAEQSDSSISYGGGLQYDAENALFRIGYETLYDQDNISADGFNISAGAKF